MNVFQYYIVRGGAILHLGGGQMHIDQSILNIIFRRIVHERLLYDDDYWHEMCDTLFWFHIDA